MEKKSIVILILFLLLISPLLYLTMSLTGNFIENNPPDIVINTPRNEEVIKTTQPVFNWVYKDKENNPQKETIIQISNNKDFENPHNIHLTGTQTRSKTNKLFESGLYYTRIKVKDEYSWSSWSEIYEFTIDSTKRECDDGTSFFECSTRKPLYCDEGFLVEKSEICGCPENYINTLNGVCKKIIVQETPKVCSDGTFNNRCNSDRQYCEGGELINNCEICGCQSQFKCKDSLCIPKRESTFKKLSEQMKKLVITISIEPTGKVINNLPPKITIKTPRNNEVIDSSNPEIEWFYSDPEKDTQKTVLIQIGETNRFEKTKEMYFYGEEISTKLIASLKEGTHYIRAQTQDLYSWSDWSETNVFTLSSSNKESSTICKDNTPENSCSINKPLYCEEGNLIENCNKCGCSNGYECIENICERIIITKTCEDGTNYNSCNKERKYCDKGNLIDNCNICGGCSNDERCIDNQCDVIQPSFKDVLITIGKFVKNKVGL